MKGLVDKIVIPCILFDWRLFIVITEFQIEKHNFKWESIVESRDVLIPPLHIQLSLLKKALNQGYEALQYLKIFFPEISKEKAQIDTLVDPEIKKIIASSEFTVLHIHEKQAWKSFKAVVHRFLVYNKELRITKNSLTLCLKALNS